MAHETSEELRNQITELRREAARLRVERLINLSDSPVKRVDDMEKQNVKLSRKVQSLE